MGFMIMFVVIVICVLGYAAATGDKHNANSSSPEMRREQHMHSLHGPQNAAMICPHCQTRGSVRTKAVTNKKGISGGKATAALLTGGVSMLATGLSRKEAGTRAHCDSCGNEWDF